MENIVSESAPGDSELQEINLDSAFKNRDDLLNVVRRNALMQGYALSIKNSKKDKYIKIGCDRGGSYVNRNNILQENRKRKTSSRLINCPFEVRGRRQVDGSWILEIVDASHNQEPSEVMLGHHSCRRFIEAEVVRIKELAKAGISPRQILSLLRQNNPNIQAISKIVYNMKAKICKDYLSGRTMVQALLEELGRGGFIYNLEYNSEGHLTHLFFAHPTSITLTKSYSNVFVMDCTYKTNRYKMPLLDIIGVSSFNSSFYSCSVFLRREEERYYVWALQMFSNVLGANCHPAVIVSDRELALMKAIQVVFLSSVNLLCVWHIEKNIVAKCKPQFKEGEDWIGFFIDWTTMINSISESEYLETLQHFEIQYKEKPCVLNYIKTTWFPFKEFFVTAWTEMHGHFGNRVTSRAEGAHAMLKKYLQVSTGDLCEVKNKICLAIEIQFQEIKTQLSSEKVRILHRFHIPLFKELITRVSVFAMDELLKQYEKAKLDAESELFACKKHFMTTMGLPCAHKIRNLRDGVLHLDDIHPQWRLDIRSFAEHELTQSNEENQIKVLLEELQTKYQE